MGRSSPDAMPSSQPEGHPPLRSTSSSALFINAFRALTGSVSGSGADHSSGSKSGQPASSSSTTHPKRPAKPYVDTQTFNSRPYLTRRPFSDHPVGYIGHHGSLPAPDKAGPNVPTPLAQLHTLISHMEPSHSWKIRNKAAIKICALLTELEVPAAAVMRILGCADDLIFQLSAAGPETPVATPITATPSTPGVPSPVGIAIASAEVETGVSLLAAVCRIPYLTPLCRCGALDVVVRMKRGWRMAEQHQAIIDMTSGGRQVAGIETRIGRILAGMLADRFAITASARRKASGRDDRHPVGHADQQMEQRLDSVFDFVATVLRESGTVIGERWIKAVIVVLAGICRAESAVASDLAAAVRVVSAIVTAGVLPASPSALALKPPLMSSSGSTSTTVPTGPSALDLVVEILIGAYWSLGPTTAMDSDFASPAWDVLRVMFSSGRGARVGLVVVDLLEGRIAGAEDRRWHSDVIDRHRPRDDVRDPVARGALAVLVRLLRSGGTTGRVTVSPSLLLGVVKAGLLGGREPIATSSFRDRAHDALILRGLAGDVLYFVATVHRDDRLWVPIAKNGLVGDLLELVEYSLAALDQADGVADQGLLPHFDPDAQPVPSWSSPVVIASRSLAGILDAAESRFFGTGHSSETATEAEIWVAKGVDVDAQRAYIRLFERCLTGLADRHIVALTRMIDRVGVLPGVNRPVGLERRLVDMVYAQGETIESSIPTVVLTGPAQSAVVGTIGRTALALDGLTGVDDDDDSKLLFRILGFVCVAAEAAPRDAVTGLIVENSDTLFSRHGGDMIRLYSRFIDLAERRRTAVTSTTSSTAIEAVDRVQNALVAVLVRQFRLSLPLDQCRTGQIAELLVRVVGCRHMSDGVRRRAAGVVLGWRVRHARIEWRRRGDDMVVFDGTEAAIIAEGRPMTSTGVVPTRDWLDSDDDESGFDNDSDADDVIVGLPDSASDVRFCRAVLAWSRVVEDIVKSEPSWLVAERILNRFALQLSNRTLFEHANMVLLAGQAKDGGPVIRQIRFLREVVVKQLRAGEFVTRDRSDLSSREIELATAAALVRWLTILIGYAAVFTKPECDDIVSALSSCIGPSWESAVRPAIAAVTVCCHVLPASMSRHLTAVVTRMSQIITRKAVAVDILEFLAGLSRMRDVYANFRYDDYRTVFAVSFRYLQHVRDQRRRVGSVGPRMDAGSGSAPAVDLYVHALAYHVITFWFLALRLEDRPRYLPWIAKNLVETDGLGNETLDDHAVVTIDMMERIAFSDRDGQAGDHDDVNDGGDPDDQVRQQSWVVGSSVLTVRTAIRTGRSRVIHRRPTGTTIAEYVPNLAAPPPAMMSGRDDDPGQFILPEDLVRHFYPSASSLTPSPPLPIPLPDQDTAVSRSLAGLDRIPVLDGHKVGIIYIGPGQHTEASILANTYGSVPYTRFLTKLGIFTRLRGATFNSQGLDRHADADGKFAICWRDRVAEMVFHVTTMMPTRPDSDPDGTAKKSHVGNDYVNVVWNCAGQPFRFSTLPSAFNHVYIVIEPVDETSSSESAAGPTDPVAASSGSVVSSPLSPLSSSSPPTYRVHVVPAPNFPQISAASEMVLVPEPGLAPFVRLLALNASVFCHVWARGGVGADGEFSAWRARLAGIRGLAERFRQS